MRRLLALLQGLPAGSAVHHAVIGDTWTSDTELLAYACELLGLMASGRQLRSVPERIPRPAGLQPTARSSPASPEQIAAFFGGGA